MRGQNYPCQSLLAEGQSDILLEHVVCYMKPVVCSWNINTPIMHLDGFLKQIIDRSFNTLLASEFDISPDSLIKKEMGTRLVHDEYYMCES